MLQPKLLTAVSGNLNTLVAGTTTGGPTLANGKKMAPGSLSCLFVVDAETDTITITGLWQVSIDGSTWFDVAGDAQNPANVVLATGTAGADAAVSKVLPAPAGVYAWPFVRPAVRNAVATGAAADTYSMQVAYCEEFRSY